MNVAEFDNGFKEKLDFSIQPVFKPQAGDLGEVHGVAGEERGVVSQGDAGDSQVHGADADALAAKASEGDGGFSIQREDYPAGEEVHALDELLIGKDAFGGIKGAVGAGQHAAKFFFERDDRGEYLCPGLQETSPESLTQRSGIGKFLEVIGIEQEHGRVSPSRSAAMLRRVGPLRVRRRRLARCLRF